MFIYPEDISDLEIQLEESHQAIENRYILLTKEYYNYIANMPFVLCRDYFNDILLKEQLPDILTQKSIIYGFNLNINYNILDENTYLGTLYNIALDINMLNSIEEKLELKTKTELITVVDYEKQKLSILKFPKEILNNTVTLHGYTYFIRVVYCLQKYHLKIEDYTSFIKDQYIHRSVIDCFIKDYGIDRDINFYIQKVKRALEINCNKLSKDEKYKFYESILTTNTLLYEKVQLRTFHNYGGILNAVI